MTSKLTKLAAAFGLALGLMQSVAYGQSTGTLTLNGGQACSYTGYQQTVTGSGLPTFNFTGISGNCASTGSQPTPGTMQFKTSTPGSVDVLGTKSIAIVRNSGTSGTITGAVSIDGTSTSACAVQGASANISFGDTDASDKTVLINAGSSTGTCKLQLTSAALGALSQITFDVVNPNQPGTLAFGAPTTQNATAGGSAVTVNVARTNAGSTATAGVTYTCTVTNTNSGTYSASAGGNLNWAAGDPDTKSFTVNLPAFTPPTTSATITCSLLAPTGSPSAPTVTNGTSHAITVTNATPPTCAPTASQATVNQGTAATVTLTSNCTGGTVTGWEWVASNAANAPVLSSTSAQNPTIAVLTTTPAGSYTYQVRGNNGAIGNYASVTVNVQTQNASCVIRTIDEFTSWAPSPTGTGETTNAPLLSVNAGQTLSIKLPYNQNYAFVSRPDTPIPPAGTFWGFFVNPSTSIADGKFATGEVVTYLASGGPYVTSVSNTPCEFVGHTITGEGGGNAAMTLTETRNGRCTSLLNSQGSLRFHRNDSTITNAQFDASSGLACRLPLPDAQGFLYYNFKPIGPIPGSVPAGCSSGYCVQILPRSY